MTGFTFTFVTNVNRLHGLISSLFVICVLLLCNVNGGSLPKNP